MMISSTSMTSTSGVTLISDLTPPLAPPRSIDISKFSRAMGDGLSAVGPSGRSTATKSPKPTSPRPALSRLPDEEVDELRRRVVHLHVEVFDAAGQVIVEPNCRNRDDEPERGLDERFRDTGRHRADTTGAAGRNALERVDDADDRAEQPDERRRGADRRQCRHTL